MAGPRRQGARSRRKALKTPSPFSIFLLAFALLFWFALLWPILTSPLNCHFAEFWLAGWFERRSLLQLLGAAIALLVFLFLIRTVVHALWRKKPVETLGQAILIAGILLAFGALRSHLLPLSFPTPAFYTEVSRLIFGPSQIALEEERDAYVSEWEYDYPPPPPHPWDFDWPRNAELFPSADSPLWSELKAAAQCRADYDAADKALREWREGFGEYRKENAWRYE